MTAFAGTEESDRGGQRPSESFADADVGAHPDAEASAEAESESTRRREVRCAVDEAKLRQWIAAVVRHDQAALAALYEAMVGRVYGLALRITRRVPTAEEVAEDTFWQVWRQAPRYDPGRGSAVAWIMAIARSRALDALRRADPAECRDDAESLADLDAAAGNDPLDLLAAIEQGNRVHAALARLEPLPRQLVALAFLRGLSHEEIAEQTGLPMGTVKSHIRRSLERLRAMLQPGAEIPVVSLGTPCR